jgi:hypothetical protein
MGSDFGTTTLYEIWPGTPGHMVGCLTPIPKSSLAKLTEFAWLELMLGMDDS